MAIADPLDDNLPRPELEPERDQGGIRLAIHDASRLEWSFSVPLPDVKPSTYKLVAELLVPSNTFVAHSPWEQLQAYARLDGAAGSRAGIGAGLVDRNLPGVDALRRETVARAAALSDASRMFARHCRLAGSLFAMAPHSDLEGALRDALAVARELAWADREGRSSKRARAGAVAEGDGDVRILGRIEPDEMRRERLLAEEWISVRYVDLLAAAERSLQQVLDSRSPHLAEVTPLIEEVQSDVADALEEELGYRSSRGYLYVDEELGPDALERYLDRASGLKKHFQEVLFLEMDTRKPGEKIQMWARVVATLLAGSFAFFLQLTLTEHAARGTEVGSGLTALAVVAGLSYAARDRFKESGREWLAGKMARFYAQRVTVLRMPSQRAHRRGIVAFARESVEEKRVRVPDPLAPHGAATLPVTSIQYVQHATVRPQPTLRAEGSSHVKYVFRYDLSPLFARMDDAIKKLPILEPGSRRVRFTDAPRCYRMQVRLTLISGGVTQVEHQVIVLSKRGLERLEPAPRPC